MMTGEDEKEGEEPFPSSELIREENRLKTMSPTTSPSNEVETKSSGNTAQKVVTNQEQILNPVSTSNEGEEGATEKDEKEEEDLSEVPLSSLQQKSSKEEEVLIPLENSSNNSPPTDCFFADATLDLEEAHNLAADAKSIVSSTREESVESSQKLPQKQHEQQRTLTSISTIPSPMARPSRMPQRPRDVPWALTALFIIPTVLVLGPFMLWNASEKDYWGLGTSVHVVSNTSLFLAYIVSLGIARTVYNHPGGGDGEDARHSASQLIGASPAIAIAIAPITLVCMYVETPSVPWYYPTVVICLWLRQWMLLFYKKKTDDDSYFFRELTVVSLDILCRQFRRPALMRALYGLITIQWIFLLSFCHLLLRRKYSFSTSFILFVVGWWTIQLITKMMAFLASGGVTSWFIQQSNLMEQMEHMKATKENNHTKSEEENSKNGVVSLELADRAAAKAALHSMPEAYRSADANAYQPILFQDDYYNPDNDNDDDEEEQISTDTNQTTVKSLLLCAMGISFGSVAQCAFYSGIPLLRKRNYGFRGMSFFHQHTLLQKIDSFLQEFSRNHSDHAMSHIAAYFKSYTRASNDVSSLMDASGKLRKNSINLTLF